MFSIKIVFESPMIFIQLGDTLLGVQCNIGVTPGLRITMGNESLENGARGIRK